MAESSILLHTRMNNGSLQARIVSSLEKGLKEETTEHYNKLYSISCLKGERVNFQLLIRSDDAGAMSSRILSVESEGIEANAYEVKNVFADLPCYSCDNSREQGLFVESCSGLYPDILEPIDSGCYIRITEGSLHSVWFEYTPVSSGEITAVIRIREKGELLKELELRINVIDVSLPEQSLISTQWFHCDCLASYYNVPVFSERHWNIIKNYMLFASRHGINCILTPILTPPLDTEKGNERPTVQLIGVRKLEGSYEFDFSLLERYIDLASECGMRYFEISHLFSQWGAEYAPKVVADVDGTVKRIFGWDTPGTSGDYPLFIGHLLPCLVSFLKSKGVLDRCHFHISDEPGKNNIEGYLKARNIALPYLEGCSVMDAMSSVELFREGALKIPVAATDSIEEFLNEDIKERWAYYCCAQYSKVSNRFIAYPSFRNRILGVQLYKFGITGFLHWGYNFYYSMGSRRLINPYLCQSGDGQVPSGDTFSVYPGPFDKPLASVRLAVFHEAVQDMDSLKLCESLIGRDRVITMIDDLAGKPVTFSEYPKSADYLLKLRELINSEISKAVRKY